MKHILVIDDESHFRDSITEVLQSVGYACHGAQNGLEGVQAARTRPTDLIICDVTMPRLDGYSVLDVLQGDPRTSLIPFIFLTGKSAPEDLRRGMSLGADDYLFKPFTPAELLDAVAQRLKKNARLTSAATGRAEELKTYLNTTLPHELRTPLTGIMGYLDLLITDFEDLDSDSILTMLRGMSKSANRLYRLVENYLAYAQLSLTQQDQVLIGRLRDQASCSNPAAIIAQVARRSAAEHKRMRDLTLAPLAPATPRIYAQNLEKLVARLVDNAFKFSRPDTPVVVEAGVDGDAYRVSITDRGRGLTASQIASVGENRQFNRDKHEQQGAGLGLILAQLTCRIFGGTLAIASTPDVGTTVTVRLPVVPVEAISGIGPPIPV